MLSFGNQQDVKEKRQGRLLTLPVVLGE